MWATGLSLMWTVSQTVSHASVTLSQTLGPPPGLQLCPQCGDQLGGGISCPCSCPLHDHTAVPNTADPQFQVRAGTRRAWGLCSSPRELAAASQMQAAYPPSPSSLLSIHYPEYSVSLHICLCNGQFLSVPDFMPDCGVARPLPLSHF